MWCWSASAATTCITRNRGKRLWQRLVPLPSQLRLPGLGNLMSNPLNDGFGPWGPNGRCHSHRFTLEIPWVVTPEVLTRSRWHSGSGLIPRHVSKRCHGLVSERVGGEKASSDLGYEIPLQEKELECERGGLRILWIWMRMDMHVIRGHCGISQPYRKVFLYDAIVRPWVSVWQDLFDTKCPLKVEHWPKHWSFDHKLRSYARKIQCNLFCFGLGSFFGRALQNLECPLPKKIMFTVSRQKITGRTDLLSQVSLCPSSLFSHFVFGRFGRFPSWTPLPPALRVPVVVGSMVCGMNWFWNRWSWGWSHPELTLEKQEQQEIAKEQREWSLFWKSK